MAFLADLLQVLGTVCNIHDAYKQIEEGYASRQGHGNYSDGRNPGEDLPELKKMLEEKLLPDIKQTTKVARDLIKMLTPPAEELVEQIISEMIPGITKATKDAIVHGRSMFSKEMQQKIVPKITETMTVFGNTLKDRAQTDAEIRKTVKETGLLIEIGLLFLLFAVAALCRYESKVTGRQRELNILSKFVMTLIRLFRCVCITYGIVRLVIKVLIEQAKSVPDEYFFYIWLPVLFCFVYFIVDEFQLMSYARTGNHEHTEDAHEHPE